jgi:hypothetical protein
MVRYCGRCAIGTTWARKLSVNGFGLLLTGIILFVTVTTKFAEGG